MIDAVILAGGKSSRMGRDKALLPFKGYSSLAKYQYERLKPLFNEVYISAKENKFDFSPPLIYDNSNISSPLIALHTILNTLKHPIFLIAVDMPLLPPSEIQKLLKEYKKNPSFEAYIFKSPNGLEPLAAIYTPKVIKNVENMLANNNHKMKSFLSNINFTLVKSDYQNYFTNLNYIKEYQKLNNT